MEIKSTVGVCTKVRDKDDNLVIIPQDGDLFEENQVVIVLSAKEFENFSDEIKSFVNLVKSAQNIKED